MEDRVKTSFKLKITFLFFYWIKLKITSFNTMINYYLFQMAKLMGKRKFNHLINILPAHFLTAWVFKTDSYYSFLMHHSEFFFILQFAFADLEGFKIERNACGHCDIAWLKCMHGTQCSDWMLTVWYIASKHVDFGWHCEPNGALLLQAWFLQLPLSIPFFFLSES